jgi:hypothetical protein
MPAGRTTFCDRCYFIRDVARQPYPFALTTDAEWAAMLADYDARHKENMGEGPQTQAP